MSQKYKNFFPVRHDAAGNLAAMYLPNSARWLYIVLCQLDNRFCRPTRDFFFRSLNDLEKDTGMNRKTIIKAKRKLESLYFVKTWQIHWEDEETGRKSEKHITAFKILQ